jgi:hypothetical protein
LLQERRGGWPHRSGAVLGRQASWRHHPRERAAPLLVDSRSAGHSLISEIDTAGKSAERTASRPATSATTPDGPAGPPESAGSAARHERLSAIFHRPKTLPAVSRLSKSPKALAGFVRTFRARRPTRRAHQPPTHQRDLTHRPRPAGTATRVRPHDRLRALRRCRGLRGPILRLARSPSERGRLLDLSACPEVSVEE